MQHSTAISATAELMLLQANWIPIKLGICKNSTDICSLVFFTTEIKGFAGGQQKFNLHKKVKH